jgi:hypothetical protein
VVLAGAVTVTPATPVGEISGYDVAETAEEIDVSPMGGCTKSYLGGPVETAITLDGFSAHLPGTDPAQDAGQALFVPGGQLSMAIQPNGTGAGKPQLEWLDVTVTGRTFAGVVDGSPTWNIEARANGATDETAQV